MRASFESLSFVANSLILEFLNWKFQLLKTKRQIWKIDRVVSYLYLMQVIPFLSSSFNFISNWDKWHTALWIWIQYSNSCTEQLNTAKYCKVMIFPCIKYYFWSIINLYFTNWLKNMRDVLMKVFYWNTRKVLKLNYYALQCIAYASCNMYCAENANQRMEDYRAINNNP